MIVRPFRFFFPPPTPPRTHTRYVDAWGEAGRRMETPSATHENDDNDDEFS